jgi:hypothetical protein
MLYLLMLRVMSLYVMSSVLGVTIIVNISKVVVSNVILGIIIVSS